MTSFGVVVVLLLAAILGLTPIFNITDYCLGKLHYFPLNVTATDRPPTSMMTAVRLVSQPRKCSAHRIDDEINVPSYVLFKVLHYIFGEDTLTHHNNRKKELFF